MSQDEINKSKWNYNENSLQHYSINLKKENQINNFILNKKIQLKELVDYYIKQYKEKIKIDEFTNELNYFLRKKEEQLLINLDIEQEQLSHKNAIDLIKHHEKNKLALEEQEKNILKMSLECLELNKKHLNLLNEAKSYLLSDIANSLQNYYDNILQNIKNKAYEIKVEIEGEGIQDKVIFDLDELIQHLAIELPNMVLKNELSLENWQSTEKDIIKQYINHVKEDFFLKRNISHQPDQAIKPFNIEQLAENIVKEIETQKQSMPQLLQLQNIQKDFKSLEIIESLEQQLKEDSRLFLSSVDKIKFIKDDIKNINTSTSLIIKNFNNNKNLQLQETSTYYKSSSEIQSSSNSQSKLPLTERKEEISELKENYAKPKR